MCCSTTGNSGTPPSAATAEIIAAETEIVNIHSFIHLRSGGGKLVTLSSTCIFRSFLITLSLHLLFSTLPPLNDLSLSLSLQLLDSLLSFNQSAVSVSTVLAYYHLH